MAVLNYAGEKSFVGRVLREREYNGYNDSDFFAEVVDDAGRVFEVEFATTRGGCGKAFGTFKDATEEALDAAERYWRVEHFEASKVRDEAAARWPEKGKRVVLTRKYNSRKLGVTLEAGTEGEVFWIGEDRYQDSRMTYRAYRVGVKFEDGSKLFLAGGVKGFDGMLSEGTVEVVGYEELLTPEAELRERAERTARGKRADYERNYGKAYEEGRARNARDLTTTEVTA